MTRQVHFVWNQTLLFKNIIETIECTGVKQCCDEEASLGSQEVVILVRRIGRMVQRGAGEEVMSQCITAESLNVFIAFSAVVSAMSPLRTSCSFYSH